MLSVGFGLAEILLRVSVGKENSTVTDQDANFLPVGQNGHATAIKVYGIRMGGHIRARERERTGESRGAA